MSKTYISKSTFLRGTQCEKSMYLHCHYPQLRDEIPDSREAIFARGTEVGLLAQKLFPGGVNAKQDDDSNIRQTVEKTKQLIQSGEKIIYEAAFKHKSAFAFIDILVKEAKGWHVYEVKSSSSVEDVHVLDAAYQLYLLLNSGLEIKDASIIHINTKYVRKGELDIHELFSIIPVFGRSGELISGIIKKLTRFENVLKSDAIPGIPIGAHCFSPYECDFIGHCWKHIPENSVFEMANLKWDKRFELYEKGIIELKDIPDDYPLSINQRVQVECERNGKGIIDKVRIKKFLDTLSYPLYFFDMETFNPAVPLYDNSRPYQQIPFQFSIHHRRSKRSSLTHYEFLADPGTDPRPEFIRRFLDYTTSPGDILVFNRSFEIGRLRELTRDFPRYESDINNRIDRIKDLMIPFREKAYYTPGMRGSYSIKAVMPEIVPELSYDALEIGDGGAAMSAYERLMSESDPGRIDQTRKALQEYCKLDTFAMARILEVLESI